MTTYKELEYLESTGTQYIDTLWHPQSNNLRVKFKVKSKGTPRSTAVCGAENSNTVPRWVFVMFGQAADSTKTFPLIGDWKNGGTGFAAEGFTFTDGTTLEIDWTANATSTTVTDSVSGTTYTHTFDTTITYSNNTTTLKLFQNGDSQKSSIDMYYYQIYDNNTLVRDMIPVLDFNNTPSMYDKVNDVLYYNQGTGQFNYGVKETESSIQLRRKFNMLLASHKNQGYTPLKYLESTGTGTYTSGQYIDTGLDYFADIEITAKQRESAPMKALATTGYYCVERENATTNAWRFRNGESTFFTTSLLVTDLHTLKWKGGKVYGDGVELGSFAKTSNTGRMYLFGASSISDVAKINRYPIQISSCRMWNPSTGELVRDYIPVLDKNGTPCMLDRVENKLYYNQGTGDFSYEEWDYTPVDYVYANGNAYTSTRLYGNSNTKMEMTFDIAAQSTQNRGSMGSRGSSANNQLLAIGYGVSALASDFNNSSYSTYRSYIDYVTNTKYRVYTSKEKRSIIDEATGTVLDENNTLCTNNMSTGVLLLCAETGLSYRHIGKIYGAKVWDGSLLERDYIPVVDVDNKGCFYDRCLNILFYSLGSSDFVGHFIENGVDYKVVESIGTSGTQYIETGLSGECRWAGSGQSTSTRNTSQCLVSSRGSTGQFLASEVGSNKFWGVTSLDGGLSTVPTTTKANFDVTFTDALTSGKINNDTVSIAHSNTIEDWRLFSVSSTVRYTFYGKVYWLKAYQRNKIVRHYIPVVRGSTAGMFDTVKRKWYGNDGTGSFTYTEV